MSRATSTTRGSPHTPPRQRGTSLNTRTFAAHRDQVPLRLRERAPAFYQHERKHGRVFTKRGCRARAPERTHAAPKRCAQRGTWHVDASWRSSLLPRVDDATDVSKKGPRASPGTCFWDFRNGVRVSLLLPLSAVLLPPLKAASASLKAVQPPAKAALASSEGGRHLFEGCKIHT